MPAKGPRFWDRQAVASGPQSRTGQASATQIRFMTVCQEIHPLTKGRADGRWGGVCSSRG